MNQSSPHMPTEAYSAPTGPVERPVPLQARQRLQVLQRFLAQDPGNQGLLTDAFDMALAAGAWEDAAALIEQGMQDAASLPAWHFRRATLLIARQAYADARAVLETLAASEGMHAGIVHNLAWIAFREKDYAACCAQLHPFIEQEYSQTGAPPEMASLQCLWLRGMHRAGAFDDALDWAHRHARQLTPAAAGVASLIAVDAAQFEQAQRWADHALTQPDAPQEALVARASVALWQQDARTAEYLLNAAIHNAPEDGRTLSTTAFLALQKLDLATARQRFEYAVQRLSEHIGTWHGLGWTCLLQHDLVRARVAFEAALVLDRNFAESHGALAVLLALGGQSDGQSAGQSAATARAEAEAFIERALRLDRACLSARYAQAVLNGEAQDADAIRKLAERLLGGRVNVGDPRGPAS